MSSFLLSRLYFPKIIAIGFMAAQLLGWVTFVQASEAPTAPALVSPPNALTAVRRALREFDRFLDHHPLLEDDLRLNPALTGENRYLATNQELNNFLSANPDVLQGLKIYPRYFVYRALLRQAGTPLRYSEIAQLKDMFDQQPAIEQLLMKNPESIRDPAFLRAHVLLRDFLTQHPVLSQAFSTAQ